MISDTPLYHAGTISDCRPYGFTTCFSQFALFGGWLLGSFGSVVVIVPVGPLATSRFWNILMKKLSMILLFIVVLFNTDKKRSWVY